MVAFAKSASKNWWQKLKVLIAGEFYTKDEVDAKIADLQNQIDTLHP